MTSYRIDYLNKNYLNFIFLDKKTMEDIQEELQAKLIQEMDLRNKNVFRIIVHLPFIYNKRFKQENKGRTNEYH